MTVQKDIIVLLSGEGTTLQSILDNCKVAKVAGVFSNNPSANGLNRANYAKVPFVGHSNNNEEEMLELIQHSLDNGIKPAIIVLAGYMKILSPNFINFFNKRDIPIINIHPSLLPEHKGLHTHRRVLEAGDIYHGMTVHYVNEELDGGPILNHRSFLVEKTDTVTTLTQKVKELEQKYFPIIIDAVLLTVH